VRNNADTEGRTANASAYHFMMLAGVVAGGWQMGVAALAAHRKLAAGEGNAAFLQSKLVTARFYGEQILPRAAMHAAVAMTPAATVMGMDEAMFG
jgi:hypothetical protein